MKKIPLGKTNMEVSEVALGCMRMADMSVEAASVVVKTALDEGINFFDHADMYGKGKSELVFGEVLKRLGVDRESIYIQSKCGIDVENGTFNYEKQYILDCVEGILKRLQTDYIDVLLLHRGDALVDPKEVSEAFNILKASGKVRHFGVSNHSGMMIDLLNKYLDVELVANQVQMSIMHTPSIDYALNFNNRSALGTDHAAGMIEHARIHDMTLQAWSPFYAGYFEAVFVDNPDYPVINEAMEKIANKYGVSKEAVAVAWISRHPAQIQTLIGSMNSDRIKRICKVRDFRLTHTEWYDLYKAAGNTLP